MSSMGGGSILNKRACNHIPIIPWTNNPNTGAKNEKLRNEMC